MQNINTAESCLVRKQSPRTAPHKTYLSLSKRYKLKANKSIMKLISMPISRRIKGKERAQKIPRGILSFFKTRNMQNPARDDAMKDIILLISGRFSETIWTPVRISV
jgi:hypothetical protein